VPIGNLPDDYPAYICDVFFARSLKRDGHVLWVSPGTRPDLGGQEEDDNRLMTDVEDMRKLEMNEPTAATHVCVDISLESLPINAIQQSSHINDVEGGSGGSVSFDAMPQATMDEMMGADALGGMATSVTSFDETAQCTKVFRVMKTMVNSWLGEVSRYKNEYADAQLLHFYRWLKSSESLL